MIYSDNVLKRSDNTTQFTRRFDKGNDTILSEELKWHFDDNDREVTVINMKGIWMFQYDNQLPFYIKKDDFFYIKKHEYHRLIYADGDFDDYIEFMIVEKNFSV